MQRTFHSQLYIPEESSPNVKRRDDTYPPRSAGYDQSIVHLLKRVGQFMSSCDHILRVPGSETNKRGPGGNTGREKTV